MKRLTSLFLSVLTFVALSTSAMAAPQRFWSVDISEPTAETASRTIKVSYIVQSTILSDSFTVELFENGASKGTQAVSTGRGGDSGVFSVAIPSTGTYNYQVTATNHGDGNSTKDSETYQIKVVSEPEPKVVTTTRVVNTAGADGQAGNAANDGAAATNAGVNAAGDDTTAGNDADAGNTDDVAAATNNDDQNGEVLGEEATEGNNANSTSGWTYVGVGAVIAAIGAALYFIRRNQLSNDL